ncbi:MULTISPECIES: sensor histidine kinase KdpD [unclassified Nocardia]|uniref:sensor histidine kinase n=1 Tax=unclassified Nocardia TaxID=2637762 RepID=UPI001CE3D4BC|nr:MULTISPECIES: HAMP domain-containing sensor histidine kinase [unclassified Nocardia]
MRSPISLRARVAFASAAAAALVVVAMSAVFLAVAQTSTGQQLDKVVKSLDVARGGAVSTTRPQPTPTIPPEHPGASGTAGPTNPPEPTPTIPPEYPGASGTARPNPPQPTSTIPPQPGRITPSPTGSGYVWQFPADGGTVAAAVPKSVVADTITQQRDRILTVGMVAIVLAAGLGWFFAHRAVLPLRRLTEATKGVGSRLTLEVSSKRETAETAELTAAMNQMLERIAAERRHTADALAAARDFAATSAHELRTPLTSMRTDLEVLHSLPLTEDQRAEILTDVRAAQYAVESTLDALERLALGELTTDADFADVDLDELIEQVIDDARRIHPALSISSAVTEPVRMRGLAVGLRSILDNAVTNSVRHGAATRVRIDARIGGDAMITLTVDDNGSGVLPDDRERVFQRFSRGPTAAAGSGLGLALVAQQARLHGGSAGMDDSPLGGTRLRVTLRMHADRNHSDD